MSDLLLSPRVHVENGMYMSYVTCYNNIKKSDNVKPTRFGITNGWLIGQIPKSIIGGGVEDILVNAVARVRMFTNVYTYYSGAHKAIKGYHVFFINDPEHVGQSFDFMLKSGTQPDMYVMICGRVTTTQREIIKRRCNMNANNYMYIYNWLINNHPSYSNMKLPQTCPQPIFIGGFDEIVNNTGMNEDKDKDIEKTFEGE